ncbi:hypothetical protein BDV18DRAFT_140647 [Aspergillus unguis]
MSTHWYFGNQEDVGGISVQSLGSRTIITLPHNLTIVASGGTVSFTATGSSRNAPVGHRGPISANNNINNEAGGRQRRRRGGRRRNRSRRERGREDTQQMTNTAAPANANTGSNANGNVDGTINASGDGTGAGNTGANACAASRVLQPIITNIPAPSPASGPGGAITGFNARQDMYDGRTAWGPERATLGACGTLSTQGETGSQLGANVDDCQPMVVSGYDGVNDTAAYSAYDTLETSEEPNDLVQDDFSAKLTDHGSIGTL